MALALPPWWLGWGLLWAAGAAGAAAAATYGEYGAHPPLYDEPAAERARPAPDDYRAHSPDAAAPLDYKYEEDIKGKTEQPIIPEMTETEVRLRPGKKHRKRPNEDFVSDGVDQFDTSDDFPNTKSSVNHFTKHRSRFKSRKFDRDIDYSSRFSKTSSHSMIDDDVKVDDYFASEEGSELTAEKSGRLDGKSHRLEGKRRHFEETGHHSEDKVHRKSHRLDDNSRSHRTTSERVVRRKPRDGYVKRKSDDDEDEEIQKMEESVDRDLQDWKLERAEVEQRRRPGRPVGDLAPRTNYDDEQEYYDMLRVMKAKNQLHKSTVPRRTQARLLVPMSPLPFEELPETRRAGGWRPPPGPPALSVPPELQPVPPPPPAPADEPAITGTTARRLNMTTSRFTPTTTIPRLVSSTMTTKSAKELSLAEKSRLSILKKIQRKESVPGLQLTAKPAVLLQVTSHMPTVVMVEPPSSEGPWLRARAVTGDSARRLRRVKQLMRSKLLSSARSIGELTDNWDDLVCDYVDMSLLDASRATRTTLSLIISFTTSICFMQLL